MATLRANRHNETITCKTQEKIDLMYEDFMDLYISESGMRDSYESDRVIEDFLDSHSFEDKLLEIIKQLETEVACYKNLANYHKNK